jgi:anti-sigma regulatory factor (Ser/Thr protein kinase)
MTEIDSRTESRVELRFPGEPEFVRLARLATADAGTRAGLDYEEIEDLRIAVSELCTMAAAEDGEVVLVLRVRDGEVTIEGAGPGSPEPGEGAEMARALVAAVVDEHDVDSDGDGTRFSITKRHRAG